MSERRSITGHIWLEIEAEGRRLQDKLQSESGAITTKTLLPYWNKAMRLVHHEATVTARLELLQLLYQSGCLKSALPAEVAEKITGTK